MIWPMILRATQRHNAATMPEAKNPAPVIPKGTSHGQWTPPPLDCPLCPRLAAFRHELRGKFPDKYNAPVWSFGPIDAELSIVGLAPGMKGANFTGRPFTGDWAGDLLYPTLKTFGFAKGDYQEHADDGFQLINARISNAVRCVPPQNKPLPSEIKTCNIFLQNEFLAMPNIKVILAQGTVAHAGVLRANNLKLSTFKFTHGKVHVLPSGVKLVNTYHTSRYNTNTGRLTIKMFEDVIALCRELLK
jgi:uracil-DNA glycosylase